MRRAKRTFGEAGYHQPMKAPALLALLAVLTSCNQLQRETSAREWRLTECNRMVDAAERERCIRHAESGYGTTGGTEQRIPPPR